jgi:hypothetical protein
MAPAQQGLSEIKLVEAAHSDVHAKDAHFLEGVRNRETHFCRVHESETGPKPKKFEIPRASAIGGRPDFSRAVLNRRL